MENLCLNDDNDDDNDKGDVYPQQQQNPLVNSTQIENDEVEILSEISDEEIDIHISYEDDSESFLWDLRRLFDLDFLDREPSPYPRGDSSDIPGDNMRTVTPVNGAGCPDENNMNIGSQQSNQHNIYDIYDGRKEKRLTKNNTPSNLAKTILSCSETAEKEETAVKRNIQEKQRENNYKTDKKALKNYPIKEERKYSVENNINIASQQTNQNNIYDVYDGETRSFNTCRRNLTKVIHHSDQIKYIFFSKGSKKKRLTKNNTSSNLAKNILSWSKPAKKEEIAVKGNIQGKQKENSYKTDKRQLKNYSKKEEQNYLSRQKQRYSSSSSSSKLNSSCSCSTGRRKRYTCRMAQCWHAKNHVHNLYPCGNSSDISGDNFKIINPVDGADCPYENNMNLLQTNQNNIYDIYDGEPRSSNTCLRNLTRVIHNSDQIKDILFSTGPKEKPSPKTNTPSHLAKNILTWSETAEKEESAVKGNIQEKQRENNYKTDKKPLKNYPKKEERKYSTRRKQRYSSSSSSSSSDSSCSCSTRRRKRHTCRMAQCCHTQNHVHNQCQHQCHGADQSGASRNIIPSSDYENPYPYSTPAQEFQQYPNFTTPQNFWSNPYFNQPDMVDTAPYPYFPNNTCGDHNYYPQTDMSDIIERMRKLDLTIGQLTQDNNSYNYPPENQHFGDPGNYFVYR